MDNKNLVGGRDSRGKSGPHVPISETTDRQWVPPTLACPFLDQGERSFIERFTRMEGGLAESKSELGEVKDQVRYMRNTLIAAIISIICSIVASITAASWRSNHDGTDTRAAAATTQGVRK